MNFRSWFLGLAVASPIVAATQPFFLADPSRPAALQPAFSTSDNIDDPASWSAPQFLFDEHLEVDPIRLQFLFQGVLDQDMKGKPDGRIPWRLGLLEFALSDTK